MTSGIRVSVICSRSDFSNMIMPMTKRETFLQIRHACNCIVWWSYFTDDLSGVCTERYLQIARDNKIIFFPPLFVQAEAPSHGCLSGNMSTVEHGTRNFGRFFAVSTPVLAIQGFLHSARRDLHNVARFFMIKSITE